MKTGFYALLCMGTILTAFAGERPYEMVWANRTHDDHPALLPLTNADGWRVEAQNAQASIETSTNELLFGDGVAKFSFHAISSNESASVTLLPPAPIAITGAFDTVTCWVYGDTHCYVTDPSRPTLALFAQFLDAAGKPFSVQLIETRFNQWFLCHRRLTPEQILSVKNGGKFVSFLLRLGTSTRPRTIYLNSLAAFTEAFPPLAFKPRAKRGLQLFPDCPQGLNTGDGRLPFPNTPDTIIPKDAEPSAKQVSLDAAARTLKVTAPGETIEYRLPAKAGTWDDLVLRCNNGEWISLGLRGGLFFAPEAKKKKALRPETDETSATAEKDGFLYRGKLSCKGRTADVTLRAHIVDRSLVFDFQALGGEISEARFGFTKGFGDAANLVTLPYYTYSYTVYGNARPAVLTANVGGIPFFFAEHIDWTQSNASTPFALHASFDGGLAVNGGTCYLPKTDAKRNNVFERFVFTGSRRFEDVLPNIPNPVSPWKKVTGTGVWNAHGAGNRDADIEYWRSVRRYGMSKLIVTDHETGWRDGDESFTFRTRPAPKKGGDEGQFRYARVMQDELGFVYGPYNNFTDFAPVNEFWNTDIISRRADLQLPHAWERCYQPKPSRAVEFCERLAPIIQKKFHFSTAYCDVHTAVTPWERTDFDARVPGAGTFAATYYAFGEIMLLQKAAWDGPVYSEGNNHFPYCGLTDGNYAQDQNYRISDNPWIVDFDLRKMHPLCCNFGMGAPGMFYPGESEPADKEVALDRFLSATVAFGHPGFFCANSRKAQMRSYFLIQALAAHYTQADAAAVCYANAAGRLFDTSAALADGCYTRNQIVTRYTDGTFTAVNGCMDETMRVQPDGKTAFTLPPNGYYGVSGDGAVHVFSGVLDGHRADCAVAPAYVYIDGRAALAKFPAGACDGQMAILPLSNNVFEVIAHEAKQIGLPFKAASISALGLHREPLGPTTAIEENGYSFIKPVASAVSYLVTAAAGATFDRSDSFLGARTAVSLPPKKTTAGTALPSFYAGGFAFRGQPEQEIDSDTGADASWSTRSCGGVSRRCLFMHPPYMGGNGAGYAFARFSVTIPPQTPFLCGSIGKVDGSDPGDGILFKVWVEADGKRTEIAQWHVGDHAWHDFSANLTPFTGKSVSLFLVADCGGNTAGDWSAWSGLHFGSPADAEKK